MYKVGDVVMYYGNKYKVCDIRDSENLEKEYILSYFENPLFTVSAREDGMKLIKNPKPKNYYSKFTVGEVIRTLDDLIAEDNVIYVSGNYRKTINCGWFGSYQLRYVKKLIDDKTLHYAIPKNIK